MRLCELSPSYRESEAALRLRIRELRADMAVQRDPEALRALERRIAVLRPLLTEMRELAVLTARYYDRGYRRSARYRL